MIGFCQRHLLALIAAGLAAGALASFSPFAVAAWALLMAAATAGMFGRIRSR